MAHNHEDQIDGHSPGYEEMAESWRLLHDLMGGTRAMRAARSRWLPMEPKEHDTQYERRLARSFLFNGFKDTVRKISSRPFMKPVQIEGGEGLDSQLAELETDVDGTGKDLTQFCRDGMRSGVLYGLGHILIDFPQTRGDETRQEELDSGARPKLVFIQPPDLWGWQTLDGELLQIRIHEQRAIPAPPYGTEMVDFIRVFTPEAWQLWLKKENDEQYSLVEEGTHTFGAVPLVSYYFDQSGEMQAEPPLEDLAFMNLAHWQSLSDQRNILRFGRMGILCATGLKEEEKRKVEAFGPSSFISSTNDKANVFYAEHSGKAIAAGEADLEKLEKRMESLGMAPFLDRATHSTATGISTNEAKGNSDMKAWIRALENGVEHAYEFAARWIGQEIPEEFSINISENFELQNRPVTDLDLLQKVRAQGDIPQETLIAEMQRRGVLSDSLTPEEIQEKLREEGPPLGLIGVQEEEEEEEKPEPKAANFA